MRRRTRRRRAGAVLVSRLSIDREVTLSVDAPEGSRFKGYEEIRALAGRDESKARRSVWLSSPRKIRPLLRL